MMGAIRYRDMVRMDRSGPAGLIKLNEKDLQGSRRFKIQAGIIKWTSRYNIRWYNK